jgi:hypothetical protein
LADASGDGVVADEAAQDRAAGDRLRGSGRAGHGRQGHGERLPQALMRPPLVVLGAILPAHKHERPLIEDEELVATLRADGSHDPLRHGVGVRRLGRCLHHRAAL